MAEWISVKEKLKMTTKEELFEAVRMIKEHCKETSVADCAFDCPLRRWCRLAATNPEKWPDPEEGGGKECSEN